MLKLKSKKPLVQIFANTKKLIKDSLANLKSEKYLPTDTETEGLSAHSKRLWSIQISNEAGDFGVLIPVNLWLMENGKPEEWLVAILQEFFSDEDKTFIFHNAKFDIQFLRANGIELSNVYCSALGEKLLTAGKLGINNDLKATLKRRFKIELSKKDRKDFYDGTFATAYDKDPASAWTPALIDYSMNDVYDLARLMKVQLKENRDWDLMETMALEFDVLPVTAKMEYAGIGVDEAGIRQFQIDMAKRAEESLREVLSELEPVWEKIWRKQYQKDIAKWDAWKVKKDLLVKGNNKRTNGKLSDQQVHERAEFDKLKPFNTKPKPKGELKLRSAIPMKATILEYAGLALPNTAKETMEQFREEYPILEQILEYKKYAKLAEFGELYEKIDPVTKRIHASYNQIVSTGRFSCSAPNLQQIPSRTEEGIRLRSLFVSREGYKFIGADFAGIELVILFVLGKDKVGLSAVNSGKDVHIFTMSKMLNADYTNLYNAKEKKDHPELPVDYELLKKARKDFEKVFDLPLVASNSWDEKGLLGWVKALRNDIKTLSYGVAYQLSKYGLARKFHCSIENAELFINSFFDVYKSTGEYVRTIGQTGFDNGYAETKLGRKRFFREPRMKDDDEIIRELKARLVKEGRNIYEIRKNPYEWNDLVKEAKKIHKKEVDSQINAIKREAGNMPIQGMSADITKLSMVLFEDYLQEAGVFDEDEALILIVHDELIAEAKDEHSELSAELLKKAMTEAAHHFLGEDILIIVEPYIETYWKK